MSAMTMQAGGCQCGAVRYRIAGALSNPHICHCRMCQKAAGNYFMPLGGVMRENFYVSRGEIAWFHSSRPIRRGFCRDCGTPLVFETLGAPGLNITLGSLDDPASVPPVKQYGTESRMPWFHLLAGLAGETTEAEPIQDGASIAEIAATSRQHPDHETENWPRKGHS